MDGAVDAGRVGRRDDRTDADLDDVLTWNLVRVARSCGQRLAGHDLHPVHFGVLGHLAVAPQMTQAALASNDLGDAGLTAEESVELDRLLLEVVRVTQGLRDSSDER